MKVDDFELSGYHNVWLRDNIKIAWAHLSVDNDATIPLNCIQSLTAFFAKYRHRFTDIIDGKADPADPMNRPHIRFDGTQLTENTEKWAHAQNDALGYFLWLSCTLILRGDLAIADADWALFAQLVRFWNVVEVWQDEDSGHWEEVPKVAASSIGCVVAGLSLLHDLMQKPEVTKRTVQCQSSHHDQRRRCSAEEVPDGVVRDSACRMYSAGSSSEPPLRCCAACF